MAGCSWQFTLSPETINEITLTQTGTSDTVTLQRQTIGKTTGFYTSHFAETNTVTISATGYQDLTNVLVGDSGLVMIPALPENLYAYTDPNPSGETLYAWTTNTSDITVSTVYTTDAIPTNTSIFYDENGNVLDITTIRYPMYKIDSFNSGSSTECIFNSSLVVQQ